MNRWWIYQRERFPLPTFGLLAVVLACSVISFSILASGDSTLPGAAAFISASLNVLLFFVLMRVADEFKDIEDDKRHRPYRPVPRGLVRLEELAGIAVIAAVAQLVLALWLSPAIVPLLCLSWSYLGLMTVEFFAPRWLKARPFLYLVSHMPMVGFIALYASAHHWLAVTGTPPPGLLWMLAASVFLGTMLEIARKIRAPADEEPGVDTYTQVWGRPRAVFAWFSAFLLAGASGLAAASSIGFASAFGLGLGALSLVGIVCAWQFLRRPARPGARRIEALSGIVTLAVYAGLGPVTLLVS